jgi:transposase InsO family protein
MLWQAQTRFFFPKMQQRIDNFVKQCTTCQRAWRDKRPAPFGHIESQGFMHTVGIDFAGPFKATDRSDAHYLGIVVDHHSKFVWVVPTSSCTAADAILTLVEFIETVGTFPKRVVSDRGSFAVSDVWKQVLANFGMQCSLITSYNPQANGHAEAQVKNIKRILKKVIQDHPNAWPRAARFAAFSYNQSYNSTIGTSPYFVRHGRHPRTTTDIQLQTDDLNDPVPMNELADLQVCVDQEVSDAIRRLGESYTARNSTLKRQRIYAVGDKVYLHRVYPDSFDKAGIDVAFYLPFHHTVYEITAIPSAQIARISDPTDPSKKPFDVHIQRLKPVHPRHDALFYEDFYDPKSS